MEDAFKYVDLVDESIALAILFYHRGEHLLDYWQQLLVGAKTKIACSAARVAVIGLRKNFAKIAFDDFFVENPRDLLPFLNY